MTKISRKMIHEINFVYLKPTYPIDKIENENNLKTAKKKKEFFVDIWYNINVSRTSYCIYQPTKKKLEPVLTKKKEYCTIILNDTM